MGTPIADLQSDLDAKLESGERKAARASWATALRTARSLGSQYPRGELMRMIVESQLKAGLLADAIEAIQAATQDTEEAEDDGDSRWVLKVVAGRASAGDFATALEITRSVEEREGQSGSDTSSCVGVCPAVPRVFSSFRFGQDRFGPGPVPGTRGSEAHI